MKYYNLDKDYNIIHNRDWVITKHEFYKYKRITQKKSSKWSEQLYYIIHELLRNHTPLYDKRTFKYL